MEFCRICAASVVGSVNIFEGMEPIANMIHELSGLEILDEYGLPDVVCCSCVDRLKSALELKQQCLKSDEKFRRIVQQESILETVYERKADPDVPIISYKILYDQVIEQETEAEYVVEVEATTLERASKPKREKVIVEYVNPPIETIFPKTEYKKDFPSEVGTESVVEVETTRSKQLHNEKLSKRTAHKHNALCRNVDGSFILEKLPVTSPISDIAVTLEFQPDCIKKEVISEQNEEAEATHSKLESNNIIHSDVKPKSLKRKQSKEKVAPPAKDNIDIDRPFRCCGCECTFSTKSELVQHSTESHADQSTSNRERPFECSICFRRYTSARGLKIHRKNAYQLKQHQCSSCGKRFLNRTLLENHERTHTSQKPFSCTECPKTFRSKSNLLSHLKLHSDIPEHTKHVCKLCNKGFSRKSYLKHHNSLLHSQETPFECTFCPNRFKAKANLRLHLRVHTQERPYSCEMCDKTFMYPTDRKRHMLQHTGQKPFKCKECDKGFTRKTLLRKHQASHRSVNAGEGGP